MFNTRLTAAEIDAIEYYNIDTIEAIMTQNEECEKLAERNADIEEWEDNG